MKNKIILIAIFSLFTCIQLNAQNKNLKSLYQKNDITVLITDSGLGGLSVLAEMESAMKNSGHFKSINLIFANALFSETGGYNALGSRDEKVKTFSKALKGMNDKFKPDIILVACNTLSTILDETEFSKTTEVPTIGIVEIGVGEIQKKLNQSLNSEVIIFGTETTIEENSYPSQLIENGIDKNRISSKACPQLQKYIETDPEGEETEMLIMSYVDEALENSSNSNNDFFISLNCTHFGYSKDLWLNAFDFSGKLPKELINPNHQMAKILVNNEPSKGFKETKIKIQVVSKVKIDNQSLESISKILAKESISTSSALKNYQLINDLF